MAGLSESLIAGQGLAAAVESLTAVDFALLGTATLITGAQTSAYTVQFPALEVHPAVSQKGRPSQ